MFFVFVVICWLHFSEVKALHCYSGRTVTENGIEGTRLMPCVNNANGCVKQDDPQTRMTDRGCMTGSCTDQHGRYSPEPICTIMGQPPYIKTCCCYGDACNGNQDETKYKVVQEENMPVQGLRCYHGQTRIDVNQPANSTEGAQLQQCVRNINAICTKEIDYDTRMIVRVCSIGNCTNQQGQYSSEPICINTPSLKQCCCHGDGCNI